MGNSLLHSNRKDTLYAPHPSEIGYTPRRSPVSASKTALFTFHFQRKGDCESEQDKKPQVHFQTMKNPLRNFANTQDIPCPNVLRWESANWETVHPGVGGVQLRARADTAEVAAVGPTARLQPGGQHYRDQKSAPNIPTWMTAFGCCTCITYKLFASSSQLSNNYNTTML